MSSFLDSGTTGLELTSTDPVMAAINGELGDGVRSVIEFSAESSDVPEAIVPMSGLDPLELEKPIGEDEFLRQARRAGTDPLTGSDEPAIQTRSGSDPGNNRRRAYNFGTLDDTKFYSDSVSRRDRKDFFKFTVEETGKVDISLSGLRRNADLFLHNSRGKTIEKSRKGGRRSEAISEILEPGDYYVQVRSRNRRVSTNYNLELNFESIIEPPPPNYYIDVTSYNGGEIVTAGNAIGITWSDNISENVKIDLYKGNDLYSSIDTESDGSYSWTAPADLAPGSDYNIKIASTRDGSIYDVGGNFTVIEPGYITLTTPNGGETWEPGNTINIAWNDNISENVKIDLYKGGIFQGTIDSTTESDGSYNWSIPETQAESSDYNIKITSTSDGNIHHDGDGNFTIEPGIIEEDPANEREEWQGWVSKWDASSGALSPVNVNENTDLKLVGKLNLGSNIREIFDDGRHGINNADWGAGSVKGYSELPTDNFLVKAYTEVDLEGGQTYEFEAKGDDGYQIWLKNLDTNEWRWVTPENEWQTTVGQTETDKFTHTIPGDKGGRYYVGFFHSENTGDAYFGLNWKEKEGNDYFNELATWSDEQWDWAAGDNTRITGSFWAGETNETNYQNHQAVLQIYNDLTTAILDKTYRSSAGYVQDPSYFNSSAGQQYGWHSGIDIDTDNWVPTDVKALVGGTARVVQWNTGNQFLEIAGDDGRFYRYGHLSALKISSGRVNQGDVIGELGMSNASNHLHFQVNETENKPAGYNSKDQDKVYQWTLNPLKVFWELKGEGRI